MKAMRSILFLALFFLWGGLVAQAVIVDGDSAAGTLDLRGESNVTFSQRTDGSKLVDIYYTLDGGTSSVALGVSLDGGTTFTSVTTLTGDVGAAVSAGTAKQIVWNAGTDQPGTGYPNVKMRVTALLDGAGGSFAPIPGGTYSMGNLFGDSDITNAGTVSVTLSPYYMAVNDTTKAQWDAVRTWATANGYTDLAAGAGKASNHPVQTVKWYDVVKWANAASEKEGLTPCYKVSGAVYRTGTSDAVTCDWSANGYRLPTEAEWEVAARGGLSEKRFPWGDTISQSQANYRASTGYAYDSSGSVNDYHPTYKTGGNPYTSPVGVFAANGYGLYDMAGNVRQWCWDWYGTPDAGGTDPRGAGTGSLRVLRGGNCYSIASDARCAVRNDFAPSYANDNGGFRLARGRSSGSGSGTLSGGGVVDTTPPIVSVPGAVSVSATSGSGATVTLSGATATDNLGTPTLTYAPASGSTFPGGTTTVTVTAKDSVGNTATGTFAVTVSPFIVIPQATNVTFSQRTDGSKLVDIYYTLDGGTSSVALGVSLDGGTTFTSVKTLTGDVGAAVSAGTAKHIIWNAGTDHPSADYPNVKMRVTALLDGAGGTFAPIPGGTYQMGNLIGDADITNDAPVTVTLSPYHMAVHDTTKAQWDSVRTWAVGNGYTDLAVGAGKATNHPVQTVSWYDVVKWANAASEKEGLIPCYQVSGSVVRTGTSNEVTCDWTANGYRLPTEAEWEVAARGGLSGKRFPWGDTISQSQANYRASTSYAYDLSGSVNDYHPTYKTGGTPYTSPVGSFAANGYGLYDMAGNVFQWCWDWLGTPYAGGTDPRGAATGSDRVLRGVDWYYYANGARSAHRVNVSPSRADSSFGFRLARGQSSGSWSGTQSVGGAVDTTLPVLSVPGAVNVTATSASGATLTLSGANATDNMGGTPTLTYAPASGSTFPVGTTTVTVTATDSVGNIASGTFTVTVTGTVGLTVQPSPLTVASGSSATFSVTPFGSAPFSYQWRKDGAAIAGGTSASLVLPKVTPPQIGKYSVVVTDSTGKTVTSVDAALNITGVDPSLWTGLVAYYPFNGNANDESGSGLHGTVLGGSLSTDRFGNASGYTFPSAGNMLVMPVDHSRFEADFTLSVWIKIGALDHDYAQIVSGQNSFIQLHAFGPVYSENGSSLFGKIGFYHYNKGLDKYYGEINSNALVAHGEWHHLAIVASGSYRGFYLDGALKDSKSIEADFSGIQGRSLYLGGNPEYTDLENFRWQGCLDDLSLYNRALSDSEVTSLYNRERTWIAPAITSQPAAASVALGAPATFAVVATGTSPSYQWRRNGVSIVGAISATYSIASVQVAQTGDYDVVVSNAAGSVTSNVAKLTIPSAVSIVTQPRAQSSNPGTAVALSVGASGPGPITYQWRRNGVTLKGATAASYKITSLQTATEGLYDVVVTNSSGSLASAQAAVSLNKAVVITKAPVAMAVNPGAKANFAVVASGTEPFTYQWRKSGVAIAGATGATYEIAAAQSANAGSYDVVVKNVVGSVTSSVAALTLNVAVKITTQPVGAALNAGAAKTLSVVATGTAPLNYQWRRNGAAISGATAAAYTIASAQESNVGVYDVSVGNVVGTVTSGTASVTLNVAPSIVSQPSGIVVNPGKAAAFTVVAGGTAPFTYQWRKNGVSISGATAATYTVASAQAANAGTYDVVVKNAAGSATSASATLGVNTAASIATQPTALTVNPGVEAIFKVTAAGTAPLTYQWRKGGIAIAGGTGASYAIRSAQGSDAGSYDVVVGNMVGSVVSTTAKLALNVAPTITVQPVGGVLNLGVSKTLSVTAGGTAPLSYQWRKDGAPIAGAVGATYALGAVQGASAGSYDVVVGNVAGSVTSAAALVSVNAPPVITVQPGSLTVAAGGTLRLGVTASGNGTLTYQWRKGGASIAGATGASYTVASAQASDAGSYDVVVRNVYGSTTSALAAVTVSGPLEVPRYRFVAGTFTWTQAKADAEAKGGHLATVTSTAEWNLMQQVMGPDFDRHVWLGASDAAVNGEWKWVTGESWGGFTNWAPGEPNNDGGQAYLRKCNKSEGDVWDDFWDSAITEGYILEIESPEIISQPASLTVTTGTSATLSVAAFGGIPLSYQWRKNGVAIASGTQAAFSLPSASGADSGNYDVVITNSKGSITSAVATLVVSGPSVAITTQPAGANVNAGSSATFAVSATGTDPLRYQWRKNGAPISGGTAASYALREIQSLDAATYDVVVSDPFGSVTSSGAVLALNLSPTLSAQPAPVAVNAGAPATLAVTVSGTGPFSFQWRKDGVPIAGGTSAALSLAAAQVGDAGLYDVVITNVAGSVTSAGARIALNSPVSLSAQPASIALNPGGSGVLHVTVSGTGPIGYQWRKDGVPIVGATLASLAFASVQTSDGGSYDVVVSNVAGSTTSSAAVVTLNTPVSITTQPQGGTFNPGAPLNLSVTAAGTAPLTYQWFKNGVPIAGATGAALALSELKAADAGKYTVLVGNVVGSVTSEEAVVSVNTPVKITSQPVALTVSSGMPAAFAVTAEGTGPLTYQWRRNGSPVVGGTAASFALDTAQAADAGSYDVLVGNVVGSVGSSAAILVVNAGATLTSQPSGTVANPGAPVTFSVTATGTGPFAYQWRRDGVNIPGASSASLTIASVQASDAGSYDVQVTNPTGSVVSDGATLSVNAPVSIGAQPMGVTVNQGAAFSLSVAATGTGPITYQWRKGGVPLAGGTGTTYAVPAAQVVDAGSYDVVLSNPVGSVSSLTVAVGVNEEATILAQPAGVSVEIYSPLSLSVTAAGTGPFTYQWRKNGVPIPEAVEAVYSNPVAGPGDGGSYDVVITNVVGSVTSALATVVVTEVPNKVYPVTITKQPSRALVSPGAPLNLRVSAVGTAPLAYQWYRNGVALVGAMAETYTVAASGAEEMGVYCVRISNGAGALLSDKVQVAVAGAPGIAKDPVSFKELESNVVVKLSATAKGSLPFNYAWKKDDGTSVASGALEASPAGVEIPLNVVASGTTMGSYRLVVWNQYGKEESAPATVELALHSTRLLRHGWTKFLDPKVYKPGLTMVVGSFPTKEVTLDDTLIVSFGSVDTHTYEWGYVTSGSLTAKPIPGQTKPYISLQQVPGISLSCAYVLQVKIVAKKTGAAWTLKFVTTTFKAGAGNALAPVAIAVDLNDAYVPSGGAGNFGVALTANGSQYGCTFNWYKQGLLGAATLVGSNSTGFFSVPGAKSTDDADYFVVVVDALGRTVESKHAHLWVFVDGE